MRVLVLTENIFNEQQLYENLQRLNYEVFISFEVLNYWRRKHDLGDWGELFSIVIVSETISALESDRLISSMRQRQSQLTFLRKSDNKLMETEVQELLNKSYNGWLLSNGTLAELRETLFAYREKPVVVEQIKNDLRMPSVKAWNLLRMNLFATDEKILHVLIQQGTEAISREKLIQMIWKTAPNNSNLSQLSFRIGRMKQKISDIFGIEQAIITDWRKGYHLSQEFQNLFQDKVELG